MALCKTVVSGFFGYFFFSFKSACIFACAFQLSSKTIPGICFWLVCKNLGTFEGKQNLPKKVTYYCLAPSHSIMLSLCKVNMNLFKVCFKFFT